MSDLLRLDKFLAQMNIGTRSEVKQHIKKGLVKVNGTIIKATEQKINPDCDDVMFKDQLVKYKSYVYYMLNKPAGVVSATEDRHDKTVLDLIPDKERKDIFPVGRLDKDTEGLLLLTNDGALAHQLLSPKWHVAKVYYARVHGIVTEEDVRSFKEGLVIDDHFTALPANLKILNVDQVQMFSEVEVEIFEGKFHQIKRMFEAVNKKVVYLKRLSMGSLKLDEKLRIGQYRELTEQEIEILRGGFYVSSDKGSNF